MKARFVSAIAAAQLVSRSHARRYTACMKRLVEAS
jgi:hypothetical protein